MSTLRKAEEMTKSSDTGSLFLNQEMVCLSPPETEHVMFKLSPLFTNESRCDTSGIGGVPTRTNEIEVSSYFVFICFFFLKLDSFTVWFLITPLNPLCCVAWRHY